MAVVGAGVFGAWTAWHLARRDLRVVVLDAYGAGHSRASSGGESRIIRMGYGADEIYTLWSRRSLEMWQSLAGEAGQTLFHRTGVLWMARERDRRTLDTLTTLKKAGVVHEQLSRAELESRYPQVSLGPVTWAIHEPGSGVLMARRAVEAVLTAAIARGATYLPEAALAPASQGELQGLATLSGLVVAAGRFVFACGPWLPKLFPELLGERIVPTRQQVLFFGTPPGDRRFAPPSMPAWIDFADEVYGIPDLDGRGFKVALDRHGPAFDPDSGDRTVDAEGVAGVRRFLARRFPSLAEAPVLEARVCQYENTSSGDFLIDRHPDFQNVWLVGGGSGHGFKHGPAVGEHVAQLLAGAAPSEPRFSLATKEKVRRRAVY